MAYVREAVFGMLSDRKEQYRSFLPDDLSPFGGYHQLEQRHYRFIFRMLEAVNDANELAFKYPQSTNFFRGLMFPSVTPPIPLLNPLLPAYYRPADSPVPVGVGAIYNAWPTISHFDTIALEESRALAILESPKPFCDHRMAIAFSAWYAVLYSRTQAQDGADFANGDAPRAQV